MTEERLIAGIKVTDRGIPDGKQLPELINKSKKNGINVTEVIGDMAYVSEENLDVCEEQGIELIANTNSAVAAAADASLDEGFTYNKDAKMFQFPANELTMRVDKRSAKNGNTYLILNYSRNSI